MRTSILTAIISVSLTSQANTFAHDVCCKSKAIQTVTLIVKCHPDSDVIINHRLTTTRGWIRHYTVSFAPSDYEVRIESKDKSGKTSEVRYDRITIGNGNSTIMVEWNKCTKEPQKTSEKVNEDTKSEHDDADEPRGGCKATEPDGGCKATEPDGKVALLESTKQKTH